MTARVLSPPAGYKYHVSIREVGELVANDTVRLDQGFVEFTFKNEQVFYNNRDVYRIRLLRQERLG